MVTVLIIYSVLGLMVGIMLGFVALWLWSAQEVVQALHSEGRSPAREWYLLVFAPLTLLWWIHLIRRKHTVQS